MKYDLGLTRELILKYLVKRIISTHLTMIVELRIMLTKKGSRITTTTVITLVLNRNATSLIVASDVVITIVLERTVALNVVEIMAFNNAAMPPQMKKRRSINRTMDNRLLRFIRTTTNHNIDALSSEIIMIIINHYRFTRLSLN
jgi:hypothetical protein